MSGHSGHVGPGLCHTLNSNILRMNCSVSFFIVLEGSNQLVSWVKWILSYPSGHTWFSSSRTNQRFTFLPYSKISSCKIVQRTLSRKHCRHCIIRVQSNHTRSRIFRRLKNIINKRAIQHKIVFREQYISYPWNIIKTEPVQSSQQFRRCTTWCNPCWRCHNLWRH